MVLRKQNERLLKIYLVIDISMLPDWICFLLHSLYFCSRSPIYLSDRSSLFRLPYVAFPDIPSPDKHDIFFNPAIDIFSLQIYHSPFKILRIDIITVIFSVIFKNLFINKCHYIINITRSLHY